MKKDLFDDDAASAASGDSSSSSSSSDSSSSSSSESEAKLKVNQKYAKEYQDRKQREELRQISQQRRDAGLDSDVEDGSSSEEDEDEDGKLLTNSVNLQFLKTMKALKKKDASIYDPKSRFFEENEGSTEDSDVNESEKKQKPKRFKDVLRDQILEEMEGEGKDSGDKEQSALKFAYDEQQEELRKAFLKESKENDDSSSEEEDWMVMKRKAAPADDPKTSKVTEEFNDLEQLVSKTAGKGGTFEDPRGEVKDGEKFLIEFMKNKKWVDRDDLHRKTGTGGDSDDESSVEDLDRADEFEAKYNFRFEQAQAETANSGATLSIQTFARGQTMNTLRREDSTRKDKRQARRERKEAERKAKEEQLKRLKNAKRQEMEQKLKQVKSVLGSLEDEAIDEVAIMKILEGDYDPEQFEKAMQEAYGDDFYKKEDAEWKSDADVRKALQSGEKEDIGIENNDEVDSGLYDEEDEEEDVVLDGNADEEEDNEEYVGGDEEQVTDLERKIKSKMQEELYKLDYEDIVGGMPTRFKYRQVEPNDYGLTTQEILLARDTTLKQFVSLKKMAPYNENGEYRADSKKRRRFRDMLKQDLEEEFQSQDQGGGKEPAGDTTSVNEGEEGHGKKKRRRLKKGKKRSKDSIEEEENEKVQQEQHTTKSSAEADATIDDEPPKKKRRKKKGPKNDIPEMDKSREKEPDAEKSKENVSKADNAKADKKKRKKPKKAIAALPKSRLASYGL